MSSELVAGAFAALVFFLVLRIFAGKAEPADPIASDARRARRYVDDKIDEHLEELTDRFVRTQDGKSQPGDHRTGDDRFAPEIEAFIGDVLERDEASPHPDGNLMDVSVREFLVLEREYVYQRILDRVHQRLAETS